MRYLVVGSFIFLIDLILFNVFSFSRLAIEPVASKILAGIISTTVAFYLHRHWTFNSREFEFSHNNQAPRFVTVQIGGVAIAAACLGISHYLMGMHGFLADNVSGNLVGLILATAFRYYFNSTYVYR